MDATIDQKQATIKDLRFKLSSLENENESLKVSKMPLMIIPKISTPGIEIFFVVTFLYDYSVYT